MKYFCLSFIALLLSLSSFGIGTIVGTGNLCQGTLDTFYDATPAGTWTSSAPLIASIGSTSGIVSALYPGTAIVTYTAGTSRAMLTVTVNPTAKVVGATTVCAGSSIILSDGLFGGTWSSSNTAIATVTPSVSNVSVTGVAAGYANIKYTLPSGCVSSALVTINPLPSPILGKTSVCLYETITLSDATLNGVWSSSLPAIATVGLTSGIVTGAAVGGVTITYTPLSGCVRTQSITVNPLPAPITGVTHVFQGNSVTLSDPTPGGMWSTNYPAYASANSTSGSVTGIKSGVVSVFYTLTATGCRSSTYFIVNPFPDSAASFPIVAWYPFCGNGKDLAANPTPAAVVHNLTAGGGGYTAPIDSNDRFGLSHNSYYFNGIKDAMSYSPYFTTATPTGEFTYSCWVNFDTLFPQNSVIVYDGTPALNGFGFVVNGGAVGTPGNLVGVLFGGVYLYLPTRVYQPPYGNLAVGKGLKGPTDLGWIHLVFEKVVTGVLTDYYLYVNDLPAGRFNNTFPYNPPSGAFRVGADNTTFTPNLPYKGYIDDIAVFNAALTPMQRTELFMFNPDPYPITLGKDTTMCGDLLTLQPTPQLDGRIYTWSIKDSLDTIVVVNPAPGITNTYSVAISQPYGCTTTAGINVVKVPLNVFIGVDTNICQGDSIVLNASYPGARYHWSTGDTTAKIKAYSTGSYYVTVDSNVCRGHDTIFVHAHVTPLVDVGPDIFNCTGSPATIHNKYTVYDSGFVYLWSNGSNLDSLVTTTSGTFWVQVNNNGCIRSDSISALIVYDTFSFFSHDNAI